MKLYLQYFLLAWLLTRHLDSEGSLETEKEKKKKEKKCLRQKRKEYRQKLKSHRNAKRNISKRWQLDLAPQSDVTDSKAEIFYIQ